METRPRRDVRAGEELSERELDRVRLLATTSRCARSPVDFYVSLDTVRRVPAPSTVSSTRPSRERAVERARRARAPTGFTWVTRASGEARKPGSPHDRSVRGRADLSFRRSGTRRRQARGCRRADGDPIRRRSLPVLTATIEDQSHLRGVLTASATSVSSSSRSSDSRRPLLRARGASASCRAAASVRAVGARDLETKIAELLCQRPELVRILDGSRNRRDPIPGIDRRISQVAS